MTPEVFDRLLFRIRDHCDQEEGRKMAIIFHGGEPTLLGRERLRGLPGARATCWANAWMAWRCKPTGP
jgi:hypothetical protein